MINLSCIDSQRNACQISHLSATINFKSTLELFLPKRPITFNKLKATRMKERTNNLYYKIKLKLNQRKILKTIGRSRIEAMYINLLLYNLPKTLCNNHKPCIKKGHLLLKYRKELQIKSVKLNSKQLTNDKLTLIKKLLYMSHNHFLSKTLLYRNKIRRMSINMKVHRKIKSIIRL